MSNRGQLFIVAAPSGAGKTSLVNALVERDPKLVISVSFTTRAPRPGEEDGVHYHFTSQQEFAAMSARGEFLESAEVFGHCYGTHRATTEQLLASGRDVILEIDWQGAQQIRKVFPACHSIFILPPSLQALHERLSHRGQDSQQVIDGRMQKARAEISHCTEFNHVLVNDKFDKALQELQDIVRDCREQRERPPKECLELLAELQGNR